MKPYTHKVQYYETDKMGITHHSNYIRWMEEARTDFLEQIGWSYKKLEDLGIISPVTSVDCKYRKTTTFADLIEIKVWIEAFKGVKLVLGYTMTNCATNDIVCTAHSEHCFLDETGNIVRLKKAFPEFEEILIQLANNS